MFCVLWEFDLLDLDISGTGGVQSPTTGTSIPTSSHVLPNWACGDVLRAVVVSKPKRGKETDKPPRLEQRSCRANSFSYPPPTAKAVKGVAVGW
jgi:hypothetical protein